MTTDDTRNEGPHTSQLPPALVALASLLSSCALADGLLSDGSENDLACKVIDVPVDVNNGNDQQLVDTCSEAEADSGLEPIFGCFSEQPFAPTFTMALPGVGEPPLPPGAYQVCGYLDVSGGEAAVAMTVQATSEFRCDAPRGGACVENSGVSGCAGALLNEPGHLFLHWQGDVCGALQVSANFLGPLLPSCFADGRCFTRSSPMDLFADRVKLADFNGDGETDLLGYRVDSNVDQSTVKRPFVLLGAGSSVLTPILLDGEEATFASIAVAQMDGDAAAEIVVSASGGFKFFNVASEGTVTEVLVGTNAVCKELDSIRLTGSDELDDFVCVDNASGQMVLLDSASDPPYMPLALPGQERPDEVVIGDTNGDGIDDVAFVDEFNRIGVLEMDDAGSINEGWTLDVSAVSVLPFGNSLAVGFFCQDCEDENVVGLFSDAQPVDVWTFTGPDMHGDLRGAADFDGDGVRDLLLGNTRFSFGLYLPTLVVIRGSGDGLGLSDEVVAPHDFLDGSTPPGVTDIAIGDLDGRGAADFVVVDGFRGYTYTSPL